MNRVINVSQEVSYGAEVVVRERQLLADSVEKSQSFQTANELTAENAIFAGCYAKCKAVRSLCSK